MELVVSKTDLLRELQLFQGIVERKNTIPILANILVSAKENKLFFLATDLEVGLRSHCAASITTPGIITIPAKKLFEIVRSLPETDIRIESDEGAVKIAADRFSSRMQTLPKEDFPALPEPDLSTQVMLPREELREMVAKTQFAITAEDTRYFLNGALFVIKPKELLLVATDGHRLAMISAPLKKKAKESLGPEEQVILPKKTLFELGRLMTEGEGEIGYVKGENHLFFSVGSRGLISRMIEGQFPAYERVLPKDNDKKVVFERERLMGAVKRVALLSNERSRVIKFEIRKDSVQVASNSPEFGEAREELLIDYQGESVQICFNAQYVLDFLGAVQTDTVELGFKDETTQAVMRPEGMGDYNYQYVIMPMRV
jgi:DNA polymerase-3 subunit beta